MLQSSSLGLFYKITNKVEVKKIFRLHLDLASLRLSAECTSWSLSPKFREKKFIKVQLGLIFIEDTAPPMDTENHVAVKDWIRTTVTVHNFRITVFCYAQHGSSAEETNRVQTAVCLFSLRFSLGLNFYYPNHF